MDTPSEPDDLRPLLFPARAALAAVTIVLVLLFACISHALAIGQRQDDAVALTRQLKLSDLCLTPAEDMRHPAWGRAEQAKAGQPTLPDPRLPTSLVRTVPMKVVK